MGADAEPNTLGFDRTHIGGCQVLLAEMHVIGAQLDGLAPVVVHDQLAAVARANLQAVADLPPNDIGGGVFEAELDGLYAERDEALQPRDVRHDWVEDVEPAAKARHFGLSRSKNGVPATGVEGAAISRICIRPASKAVRPALIASAKARAMRTGSADVATAVFSRMAS